MELRRWLVSEIVAPTLTLSAFCDTEFGCVFESRVPHLQNCRIANLAIRDHYQSAFTMSPIRDSPSFHCSKCVSRERRDMRIWLLNGPSKYARPSGPSELSTLPPARGLSGFAIQGFSKHLHELRP
jgi:hypothetical protein